MAFLIALLSIVINFRGESLVLTFKISELQLLTTIYDGGSKLLRTLVILLHPRLTCIRVFEYRVVVSRSRLEYSHVLINKTLHSEPTKHK
jgi:hypothetical protein